MSRTFVYLDFIQYLGDGVYRFEGFLTGKESRPKDIAIQANATAYHVRPVDRVWSKSSLETYKPQPNSAFEVDVKIDPSRNTNIAALAAGRSVAIKTNRFTGLSRLPLSYRVRENLVWIQHRGRLIVKPKSRLLTVWLEFINLFCIATNWRAKDAIARILAATTFRDRVKHAIKAPLIIGEAVVTIPRAFALRLAYRLYKPRLKRPIWIISDRAMAAGDNGEALFRYISQQSNVPADVYFGISRRSPDYNRLKRVGKVMSHGSLTYKLKFLLADKIISSQADIEVTNPFIRQIDHYVDLFSFDFIFLQHGIIRHDLSGWLNRFDKNITLFITSSQQEYDSILSNPYYYTSENLVLSGLPRYDLLNNNPKNKIILAPTYRSFLLNSPINRFGERKYDPSFKKSDYFKFYNKLINDSSLLEVMQKSNMKGEFYIHPVFARQVSDFDSSEDFRLMSFPYNYSAAFEEGCLLISDYSSLTFDFAYLRKPVIYAHFDVEDFYAGHTSARDEFFDDEQDGFGDVCADYEKLVKKIVEHIETGCEMSDKYKKRADKYFAYNDKRNRERVYDAILGIDTQGEDHE